VCLATFATAHACAAAAADSTVAIAAAGDDLDASWQAPWNPPSAIPRRRVWERAMLAPQRVATLPISAVGRGMSYGLEWAEGRGWISSGPPAEGDRARHGMFALEPPLLGGGVGLGAAAAVRYGVLPGRARFELLARHALTQHHYHETTLGLVGSPAWIDYHYAWRPQEPYYGEGPASRIEDHTDYATQYETMRFGLQAARGRPGDPGGLNSASVYTGPRSAVTRTGREPGRVSFERLFPDVAGPVLNHTVDHEVYGLQLLHDGRAGEPHWGHGWRGQFTFERYGGPLRALALRSANDPGARFWKAAGEAETAVSWWRDPRTLRLLVRVEDRHVLSGRDRFLPGDLATLGGAAGLEGFDTGRFHGLDAVLTQLAYVFPVSRRVEMDLHGEWGNTYGRLGDVKPGDFEHSAGVTLRLRWEHAPLAAIGFDASRESVRLTYGIGGLR